VGQEQIAPAADVDVPEDGNWHGVGSGWAAYGDLLAQRLGARVADTDPGLLCSAQDVAVLGATGFLEGLGVPAEQALPVYLRDRVARRPGG
jgi:tRNA threonylcarbamoyladenosine biosynthesis protein TsaB